MEVEYWCEYKMVDYITTMRYKGKKRRIGVSVTRAMHYQDPLNFTAENAYNLIRRKVYGLIVARRGVTKKHSFSTSVLHVWCQTDRILELVVEAFRQATERVEEEWGQELQLLVTVCNSPFIFTDHVC